jgi:hypothetical protein
VRALLKNLEKRVAISRSALSIKSAALMRCSRCKSLLWRCRLRIVQDAIQRLDKCCAFTVCGGVVLLPQVVAQRPQQVCEE